MSFISPQVSEIGAGYLRAKGPLDSWRMPSWDEREGYYEDGTVLRAEDVPLYLPPSYEATIPPFDVATTERWVRFSLSISAPYYRLTWVPIERLRPQRRELPHEVVWIEKFVDLIRRGSEPPPVICDLITGSMWNGSVRTHALRAVGRDQVHAWVADRDYKPTDERTP